MRGHPAGDFLNARRPAFREPEVVHVPDASGRPVLVHDDAQVALAGFESDPSVAQEFELLPAAGVGDVEGAAREIREFLRLAPDDPEAASEREILKAIE